MAFWCHVATHASVDTHARARAHSLSLSLSLSLSHTHTHTHTHAQTHTNTHNEYSLYKGLLRLEASGIWGDVSVDVSVDTGARN